MRDIKKHLDFKMENGSETTISLLGFMEDEDNPGEYLPLINCIYMNEGDGSLFCKSWKDIKSEQLPNNKTIEDAIEEMNLPAFLTRSVLESDPHKLPGDRNSLEYIFYGSDVYEYDENMMWNGEVYGKAKDCVYKKGS